MTIPDKTITVPYIPLQAGTSAKWEKIGYDNILDKWVYNVKYMEIAHWIEKQPTHMWKFYDIPEAAKYDVPVSSVTGQNYIFAEEMEAWFLLRYS